MYPLLDSIRKIARYTPHAWGGTMAEVGAAKSPFNPILDMAASFVVPGKAAKGLGSVAGKFGGEALGKAVASKAMLPAFKAYDWAKKPFQMASNMRHASRYGARLGASNPYLASSL